MPALSLDQLRRHNSLIKALDTERAPWVALWRELSDNYLPQRYRWLMSAKEYYASRARRQYIINNTGTQAARVLSAGMMNGITSPSRPWFKLRIPGLDLDQNKPVAVWLEEVEKRMMQVMAESNFYNSMAVLYLDMAVFGTAVSIIYEDPESVIRCYNPPLGEYFLGTNQRGAVDLFARKFMMKIRQYIERWPDRRYWSDRVKMAWENRANGALEQDVEVSHVIGPNNDPSLGVASRFKYYELYWETNRVEGDNQALEKRGFNELPGIFARWELSGSDAYGVGPGMDALGDNIELQHLHRNKAELLEKTHKPALLVDIVLQNNPVAFMPNGKTFVPNLNNTSGARPIHDVQPRFDQLNIDQVSIERRIQNTFYNFLFNGITQLDTVRSATEIESRETERLILLGGVLERFESEGLDPGLVRVFGACERAGLFPPAPPEIDGADLEIQYVSILSVAQRAAGTAPTERFLSLIGNLAAVYPGALDVPDFDRLLINYALDIGVRQSEVKTLERIIEERAARQEKEALAEGMVATSELSSAAKNLSAVDVGGGQNAVQALLQSGGVGG